MPLREQGRIKADTVAEECTCEECPAPAPEPSAPPKCKAPEWCGRDLYDPRVPAPVDDDEPGGESYIGLAGTPPYSRGFCSIACQEAMCPKVPLPPGVKPDDLKQPPSAPPAGAPVCQGGRGKCGTRVLGYKWGFELEGMWFCSQECRTAHIKATPIPAPAPEPSAPPAGVPVCQRCGQPMEAHRFYCDMSRTVECPPPSDPARVRNMREAAADKVRRYLLDLGYPGLADSVDIVIRALPLDTGTAPDACGEAPTYDDLSRAISELGLLLAKYEKAQADAIKAAVDKANNRAADAFSEWVSDVGGRIAADDFEAWLRSGEDAPGAVGK